MTLPQQKYRELILQLLYGYEQGPQDDKQFRELMMKELKVTKRHVREAQERVALIRAEIPRIDHLLSETSSAYDLHRIQSVERNVLRLGVFEILVDDSIPPKVAISEAIRLARKFSTPEAACFVNAVLDAVYKVSLGEGVDAEQIGQAVDSLAHSEEVAEEAAREEDAGSGGLPT